MTQAKALLAAAGMILFCGAARAEGLTTEGLGRDFTLTGGFGLMNIDAHEFVWNGDYKMSQLDWKSRGVVLFTLGAEEELKGDYLLKANFGTAMGGDGDMVDYDWLKGGPNGPDDWTDRSLQPDTRLEYYVKGSLEIYKRMWADDDANVRLGAGLQYTDLKWGAYGGSYIYSSASGFRDDIGNFADGERGISYRMQIPVTYASIAATRTFDRFTFDGDVKAGLSFGIDDTDDHWARDTRFYDWMSAAPMVGFDLKASYAMEDNLSIYLGGSFEKIFDARGNTKEIDHAAGTTTPSDDSAGASYQSMNFTFGMKRQF